MASKSKPRERRGSVAKVMSQLRRSSLELVLPLAKVPKKRVGDYELSEILGEGSFAVVRRAKHVETGDEFAIKCIDKSQVEKQKMSKQLKREIAVMKKIKHPRVVRFHEVLASKTKIYLVLELLTGGELFDKLVKEKGFGEDKARHYFQQLVEGVACCHAKGIVHRDLKPENLFLDENGELKITDFGLSALHNNGFDEATLTSSEMLHTTCGSPNYVSPEVIDSDGYDGRKADVWSLGVILYVLTTGRLPFNEKNISELFAKISKAAYVFPDNVSPLFKDLVSKLLVPNPKERLTLMKIKEHTWYNDGISMGEEDEPTSTSSEE